MMTLRFAVAAVLFATLCEAKVITPAGLDSESIAKALAAATPGDTVRLQEATYAVHGTIEMRSGVKLRGAGQANTVLRFEGVTPFNMLSLDGCTDVEISRFTLDGAENPNARQGISGGRASRLRIHDVTIRDLVKGDGFGPHGILFAGQNPSREGGVTDSEIADCHLFNIGVGASFGGGIRLSWGSSHNVVRDNNIENTGRGGIFTDNGSTDNIILRNKVTGSGGEELGIEVWGGGDHTVVEDNRIDHWLSIGGSDYCAVRRNVISDYSGHYAFCGIEAIGSYLIVTDNTVDGGQQIGLSVSASMPKQYGYWAGNAVRNCSQWGTQFQGEQGGIAYQYMYQCSFEDMPVAQGAVWYPGDEGHGFRINGHTRCFTFDRCQFRNNGRYGIQFVGDGIDAISFRQCEIADNRGPAVSAISPESHVEWQHCKATGNTNDTLPGVTDAKTTGPKIAIQAPPQVRAGTPATFELRSNDDIAAVLWDFGEGIPVTERRPTHTFSTTGHHTVVAIAWNRDEKGTRAEVHTIVTEKE